MARVLFFVAVGTLLSASLCVVAEPPGGNRATERAALWKQVSALSAQRKFAEAITAAEKVVAIDRDNHTELEEQAIAAEHFLGQLYWKAGRLEDADKCLREVCGRANTALGSNHPAHLRSWIDLGNVQAAMGLVERSDRTLRDAYRTISAQGNQSDVMAYAARSLGRHYLDKGEAGRAAPLLEQARSIRAKAGKDKLEYVTALNDLAVLYSQTGRYKAAVDLDREALEITRSRTGENSADFATCLNNLSVAYHHLGDLAEAKQLAEKSLAVEEQLFGGADPRCAAALLSLGQLCYAMGEYSQAETYLRRTLLLRNPQVPAAARGHVLTLRALADVCMATGRSAEALDWQWQALESDQERVRSVFAISTESGMFAFLARIGGDIEAVLPMVLSRQDQDPAVAMRGLTWVLRRKGIVVETITQYRRQEQTVYQDPSVEQAANNLQMYRKELASVEASAGGSTNPELEDRRRSLSESVDNVERLLHGKLSAYRKKQTQPFHNVEAEQLRDKMPADAALIEFVRTRWPDFTATKGKPYWGPEHYVAFAMRAGGTPPVRLFDLGPADVMDSAIRALRQKVEQAPRDLRTSDEKTVEEDFRSASNDLYKLLFSPLLPVIGSAKLVYIAADGEINRVPLQALVDQDDRYLVESYRFVYVLTGRDLVRRPVPKFLPQMVAVPGNKSKLLVPTVPRPQTRPGEIRPPIIKPGLGTIIFAAPDYDSKLGQRVAQAPDGIPKNDTVSPEVGRGATSDETRGLRWRPLPGAAAEAEDLVKVLMEGSRFRPVKVYKGADAREEMFKAITAPQILHVATHGFYLPDEKQESSADDLGDSRGGASVASLRKARNPLLRSGIVLAGANAAGNTSRSSEHSGLVTAEEIALMNLRATELVVLSACESGLGNVRIGEGVYGLRHAFLYAGARTLVTSLFEVPDVETRELMRRFYQGLGAGRGKLEALNEAQLEMLRNRRKEKGAAHPFYWASFIVVGDPA